MQIGDAKARIADLRERFALTDDTPVMLSEDGTRPFRRQRYNLGNILVNLSEWKHGQEFVSETRDGAINPIDRIGVVRNGTTGQQALLLVVNCFMDYSDGE